MLLAAPALAAPAPGTFADPAMEARARNLQRQLRCLVCQGESIDESQAPLAAELRQLVRQQMVEGRTDRQIQEFLGYCADASDRTGVVVAIEPLNLTESNILNTVTEGAEMARRIGRPGVRDLADTYHMEKDGEPLSAIVAAADVLAHTHTADTGRFAPGTGTYDHVAMFRAFREAGYDARLSIECAWNDFNSQIGPALAHLKAAHEKAQA